MVNNLSKLKCTQFLSEDIQKVRIAVIGDVMLDSYFYGEVKRISPEAPVPVNRIKKVESVLGGAANVAANLARLECQVFIGGVTGNDENRRVLEGKLAEIGVDYLGLIKSDERSTITKMRVLGANQQMLRLDFEEVDDLNKTETKKLEEWFEELLKAGLDGVIISDYAKGVCSDNFCAWAINAAHKANVPVLVDPKGANWDKYAGCDFITPNLKEMCEAGNQQVENEDEAVLRVAEAARKHYKIKNVVVTRSEKGMTLVGDNRTVIHSPATALEVFDVSGAGDTVAASLLAGIAGKLSLEESIYMANKAAGIVVGKVGTYPVAREELLKDLIDEEHRSAKDYSALSWNEILLLVKNWRDCEEKIVFTNGCFDILHVGHISYLEEAAKLGNRLVIGLNSDKSVNRLKGSTRPLVNEVDRAKILSSLAFVDGVVLFDEDTPAELIKKIKPDILVKGGDYKEDEVVGREDAGEVKILSFEDGYSTTGLIEKIANLVREGKL